MKRRRPLLNRTPLRATPKLAEPGKRKQAFKCSFCREPMERAWNPRHGTCSLDCTAKQGEEALAKAKRREEKALRIAKADERSSDRARREALKRRRDWLAEAQDEFNRYVRLRDVRAGHGCVSCTKKHDGTSKIGGAFDCGHYRSRGSAPHLRFHLHNVALQCKRCNDPKKGGGMPIEFERGLRARLGGAKVDAIKTDQTLRKFPIDYLRRLKAVFAKKARREEKRMTK